MTERYVTVTEAAARLGITTRAVHALIERGLLTAVQPQWELRILETSLIAEQQRREAKRLKRVTREARRKNKKRKHEIILAAVGD